MKQPTLEGLLAFARSKPPNTPIDHRDYDTCVIGRYFAYTGADNDNLEAMLWTDENLQFPNVDYYTYGSFADRLEKQLNGEDVREDIYDL